MSAVIDTQDDREMIAFEEANALLHYDQDAGLLTWKVRRGGAARAGSIAGGVHGNGYITIRVGRRNYKAHRLAWLLAHGSWPTDQLDHINGERADNRLSNLRECSAAENQQNRALNRDNTSGFTGVSWNARDMKWQAQIMAFSKRRGLGYYDTAEQASAAYLAAKAGLHQFQPTPRVLIP